MNDASAIFDLPGPRGQALIRRLSVISCLVIAAGLGWAIIQFGRHGQFDANRWAQFAHWPIIRYLLLALSHTLLAAGGAALIAVPLGIILAVGRLHRIRLARLVSTAIIEFFRAVPLLLVIFIFFFALPRYGINPPLFWKLVISISLCEGAVLAEVFRAGILALPKGQSEAGACLGLTEAQVFWIIVFPQAVRLVVPSLVAQLVILLKDTTLGYAVSYSELQMSAQLLTNTNPASLVQTYIVISAIYIGINGTISVIARRLDRRWGAKATGQARAQAPVIA